MRTRIVADLEECGLLWKTLLTPRYVSDLWEFRLCFHRHYKNTPYFIILEDEQGVCAMLPLCYVPEGDMFVFFPGETWKGRTWLERTPVYLRDPEYLAEAVSLCPDMTYLRYLELDGNFLPPEMDEDEIGYLLYPPVLEYDISQYYGRFTWKKLKAIKKEVSVFGTPQAVFHVNRLSDYDSLVRMNVENFGVHSYFHDTRFAEGFRDALHFLERRGWLRLVCLSVNGRAIAADLAALFQGSYVVFLGGTHPEHRGVAKAMNMHHIEYAFEQRVLRVDFLCGDFYWKKIWHLDPEPLYKYVSPGLKVERPLQESPYQRSDFPLFSAHPA